MKRIRRKRRRFRLSVESMESSRKASVGPQCHEFLSSSLEPEISGPMKTKSAAWRLQPQLHNCKLHVTQKSSPMHFEKLLKIKNYFRGEYYALLLVSGDQCEVLFAAIAPIVLCIVCRDSKSEASIETLGTKKSSVLANPVQRKRGKRGYCV